MQVLSNNKTAAESKYLDTTSICHTGCHQRAMHTLLSANFEKLFPT